MSEETKEHINILTEIFHYSTDNSSIIPIIKNPDNIIKLKEFMNNKHNNNKNKLLLLKELKKLFEQNDILILYIINKCYKKTYFFYYPIINLYLSEDINEEDLKFLDDFLFLINSYITLHKKIFECIYQKLSKFFTNRNKKKLNESQFIRYLYLLKLFYTDTNNSENIEKNECANENENNIVIESKKSKKIKNYIYFTGNNSGLLFSENDNPTNGNISFPSLSNGISFIFWFNIKKDLLNYNSQLYPEKEINLIELTTGEYKIKLIFKENKFFILKINEIESTKIIALPKEDEWNFLSFVFNPKEKDNQKLFKLIINNTPLEFDLSIPDNLILKKKLDCIKCFENFIGKISSILIFTFALDEKKIMSQFIDKNYLSSGFYKNKILFRFLCSQNENYFKYENNYKYKDLFKNEKNSKKNFNFESNNKKINNLINLFCPFAYDKEANQLDDIFGNYLGKLSKNDGANFFINYTKDIIQIVDINNLIPIAELMLSSINGTPNPSYTQVEKDILSEKAFFEYLNIIKIILNKHKRNIKYINSGTRFLWILSLIIEKFPRIIFTEKIMNILIDIEKEINKLNSNDIKSNNENYINYILLNEKIYAKFAEENQNKFWKQIFEIFRLDLTKLENYINISRICQIIRNYDQKRNEQFCCSFHANLILKENEKRKKELNGNIIIMKPKMEKKVENLFNIIQLFIDKLINIKTKENNQNTNSGKKINNLYQLLCLDHSPCLQKKIIQVYINHFNNSDENVSKDDKLETLKNLFRNDFIEITEYVLSISLIDIRHQILNLFITILNNFFETFISYYHGNNFNNSRLKNIMYFIGNNPLPKDTKINLEENKDDNYISKNNLKENDSFNINDNIFIKKRSFSLKKRKKQINKNSKYIFYINSPSLNSINDINDEIYVKEIKSLNAFLIIWVKQLCDSKKEINPFIIELLINFSKKLSINYIYKLSYYLLCNFIDTGIKKTESNSNSKLKNLSKLFSKKIDNSEEINNHLLLLSGKKIIYSWVVDTIFYFKSIEKTNEFSEKNKQKINSIQSYSIEVFRRFFNNEKEAKELNLRIKYFLDYLTYMKNYYKNKRAKLDELVNIARELIEKIIFKFSEENINITTTFCFRFIILFKNSDKLFNINFKNNSSSNEPNENNIIENKNINNQIDNKNIITSHENKLEEKNDYKINIENKAHSSNQNTLIPDYILEGLYLNNEDNSNISEKNNLKIENIWKDFTLCNSILNVYQNRLWCTEHLCKKIGVENKSDFFSTAKLLLEKYGNKNDKKINNILMADILELFIWSPEIINDNDVNFNMENKKGSDIKLINIKNDNKKDLSKQKSNSNSVNILYLNIILLSLELHLAKNDKDKNIYIDQYQQFLIFCILASININPSVKQYGDIQDIFYNILGYGFSFLKLHSEDKYSDLIQAMILPIIEDINQDYKKSKLRNIFRIQNKILHENTAVFKLFIGIAFEGSEKIKDKDNQQNNNKNKVYFDFNIDVNKCIKKIFESTLKGYKNYIEKNPLENIVKFYEKFNEEDKKLKEEKNIITKKIKELININKSQTLDNILIKNNKYKKLKKNYKDKKAELFSWRGFWSDRFLFLKHPEYLKNKIKNHYTEGMYKVLLSPILDVKYYLPDFRGFDKSKLFNENDYQYNINLNIDEILKEKVSSIHKDKNNKNKNENLSNNTHKFNYLESIYKNNYEGIWELYQSNSNKSSSNNKLKKSKNNQNTNKIDNINKEKNQNSIITENKINSKKIKYINCCLVKPSHHIKGKIKIDNNNFNFFYESYEYISSDKYKKENENDPKFDKLSGCCFGSYFKYFLKDKDKIELSFKYSDIKYIFIRIYFYYESALEIYTFSNKSYYLNFKTNEEMKKFLDSIIYQNPAFIPIKTDNKRILGYVQIINENEKKKCYYISKKQEDWLNYRISTFEYLMWLNIYSGRSFNDITQYPVLPWTLIDFDINGLNKNKRDLSLPMGMIEFDSLSLSVKRKKGYIEVYQNTKKEFEYNNPDFDLETYFEKGEEYYHSYNENINKMKLKEGKKNNKINKTNKGESETQDDEILYEEIDVSQIPYIYGSHYSNPLYISHYLVRIFPFSFISLQIHGDKFDDPYRMFFSIKKTFECVCTLKEDVRELIPEFYTFPEMLLNINNLDLSQGKLDKDGNKIILNNVMLPSWSENNIGIFISEMRNFIENNSKDINKWIDLIFGVNQKGTNAESNNNLFMSYSYERMVKIEEVKDPSLRETLMRFIEIGITPFKLFFNETKDRINLKDFVKKSSLNWYSKDNFIYEYKKLEVYKFNTKNFDKINDNLCLPKNKNYKNYGIKVIYIKQMNIVNKNYLQIITSSNFCYEMKYNNIKGESLDEEPPKKITNNSSYYTASYSIFNLKSFPIAVYRYLNCEYLIKGGFWDGRLEINDLSQDSSHTPNCIFPDYNQPIILLRISPDKKHLFCGTYSGNIIVYQFNPKEHSRSPQIKMKNHSDEITDMIANSFLNIFASVSKDGYLFLYTLPDLKLVRAIKISYFIKSKMKKNVDNLQIKEKNSIKDNIKKNNENNKDNINNQNDSNNIIEEKKSEESKEKDTIENNSIKSKIQEEDSEQEEESEFENEDEDDIYADNVFLSSSPLPCVTVYISKIKLFITMTLNGEFVSEKKEENNSTYITCSKIIKSLTSQEFLIYGTDNGYIKIRRFPDMKFIGDNIKITNGDPIETLAVSEDNKYCFAWSKGNEIYVINDINSE